MHAGFALAAQVPRAVIDDINAGRRPATADAEELALTTMRPNCTTDRAVSQETYRRALGRWGVVGVVELTALIGYYTMVAMTLNAHEFPLPDGVEPPFPPQAAS